MFCEVRVLDGRPLLRHELHLLGLYQVFTCFFFFLKDGRFNPP